MGDCYRVIFRGDVAQGYNVGEVREKISSMMNNNAAITRKLFSGKTVIIKKDSDLAKCEKIRDALLELGAVCFISDPEPEGESKASEKKKPPEQQITPSSAKEKNQENTTERPIPKEGSQQGESSQDSAVLDLSEEDIEAHLSSIIMDPDSDVDCQPEVDTKNIPEAVESLSIDRIEEKSEELQEERAEQKVERKQETRTAVPPKKSIKKISPKVKGNDVSFLDKLKAFPAKTIETITKTWGRGSVSIKYDYDIGGFSKLFKNKYFLSPLITLLVLISITMAGLMHEETAMPLTEKNVDQIIEHIGFVEIAFTPKELQDMKSNPADYLDYLLVLPIEKLGYEFEESILTISTKFLENGYSGDKEIRARKLLEVMCQEHSRLSQYGIISAMLNDKLSQVARRL